jgi:hypothetical protein
LDARLEMSDHAPLLLAYVCNIVILMPVCWAMFVGRGVDAVFQRAIAEEPGLRLLVGSVWLAILVASFAGMIYPRFFAPMLLVQVLYKAIWLVVFVAPTVKAGGAVPVGIAVCFAAIVMTYPFLFWLGYGKG